MSKRKISLYIIPKKVIYKLLRLSIQLSSRHFKAHKNVTLASNARNKLIDQQNYLINPKHESKGTKHSILQIE